DTSLPRGSPDLALEDGFVEVVPSAFPGHTVYIDARGRKDPLPHPLPPSVRILPGQGRRQLYPASPSSLVTLVLRSDEVELPRQVRLGDGWQHRRAVLVALATPNHDLIGPEVDVLDPEAATFEHAEAGPVHQPGHEPRRAAETLDYRADLIAGEDDRQARRPLGRDDLIKPRQLDAQHLSIQEQERAQCLVLRRRRHAALDGEGAEESRDLRPPHLQGMPLAVEDDVASDPRDVRLLGTAAVVAGAQALPHAVEQSGLRRVTDRGFARDE